MLVAVASSCSTKEPVKPNVLFIAIDDLRPALGCYGYPDVKTPNIDRFSAGAVQFNQAFCNVPVCGASRSSLLTGLRPQYPNRFINHASWAEQDAPGIVSLPAYFKEHGYTTISNGKVFHHQFDHAAAWSEPSWRPDTSTVINYMDIDWIDSSSVAYINPKTGCGPYFECANAPDSLYFDSKVTAKSVNDLKRLAAAGEPFFLGVGFHKPHLPFNATQKYFDLYDTVQLASNRFVPENLPEQVKNSREIFIYGRLDHYNTTEFHYEAREAYYACVSYIDDQVEILLNTLRELGLYENTIIVLFGDHGWNLGEHNYWGKHNVFYNALHVPLIIKAPGIKQNQVNEIVEYVDLYPTLCELAGLTLPMHLEGQSFAGLLKGKTENWKNTAVCEWQGARTLVTEDFSYSYWFLPKDQNTQLLFDHRSDPDENKNVVSEPEYADMISDFRTTLETLYAGLKPAPEKPAKQN